MDFDSARLSKARLGVGLIFLVNGAGYANLVPRLPEVKAELGLTNSQFGLAIAAYPAGALAAGLFAGVLIRRLGSPLIAWAGMILAMLAIMLAAMSPSLALFALAIFLGGCADSVTDVAQNHHGLRVQKLLGRSIINSYHAMWSVGALLGGVMGAGAIGLGLQRGVHLAIVAALILVVTTVGWRMMLPGPEPTEVEQSDPSTRTTGMKAMLAHPGVVLAALSVLAIAGAAIEESAGTWSAVYLRDDIGVTGSLAASAYIAAMGMHFLGRVTGDGLVNRFGQRRMALFGGVLTFAGMGLLVAVPSLWTTVLGYACAGYGVATVIPSVFEAADDMPGFKPGTALTVTSMVLRVGFLGLPPLVGLIADATAIRWGLLVVPVAALLVISLAWVLSDGKDTPDVPVPSPGV